MSTFFGTMAFHTFSIGGEPFGGEPFGGESLHRIDDVYQRKNIHNKSIEENELQKQRDIIIRRK